MLRNLFRLFDFENTKQSMPQSEWDDLVFLQLMGYMT